MHILAKVTGWAQFVLNLIGQVASQPGGLPHGILGWTMLGGSLATAVAVHAASKTDGTK